MAASQSVPTTNSDAEIAYPPLPQFSASGRPNTRSERIAFQVWVIMFLLVIVFTLINYLVVWRF